MVKTLKSCSLGRLGCVQASVLSLHLCVYFPVLLKEVLLIALSFSYPFTNDTSSLEAAPVKHPRVQGRKCSHLAG